MKRKRQMDKFFIVIIVLKKEEVLCVRSTAMSTASALRLAGDANKQIGPEAQ